MLFSLCLQTDDDDGGALCLWTAFVSKVAALLQGSITVYSAAAALPWAEWWTQRRQTQVEQVVLAAPDMDAAVVLQPPEEEEEEEEAAAAAAAAALVQVVIETRGTQPLGL